MENMNVVALQVSDTAEHQLKEAKRKLENKYCVLISNSAFDLLAAQDLSTFAYNPTKIDEEGILEGACKRVFERFKNRSYESTFYEKANQLRWALVEVIELQKELNGRDTQSWVARLKWESDCTTIFMDAFSSKWKDAVKRLLVLTPECLQTLSLFNKNKSNNASSPETSRLGDAHRSMDGCRATLIRSFSPLLTVKRSDVAEVVSNMTDVPSTMILGSRNDYQKECAIKMTCLRVVDQEHVISEIYETLASSNSSTRPRGSFLLLGQSGAGKTEIAKAVAKHWYCDVSRLVEMDVSEYADESVLWRHLGEVVRKRPFSVIVLEKIEKASPSVTRAIVDALRAQPPSGVDLSNTIIFMTSSVGSDQLAAYCRCHRQDEETLRLFLQNPGNFRNNHACTLRGTGPERALIEARRVFSSDLLDSVDKVFAIERCRNYKTVFRVLLREIVKETIGEGLVVHVSDAALHLVLEKGPTQYREEGGKALKKALLEHIIPRLLSEEDLNNVFVHVDRLGGAQKVSFKFLRGAEDDWYYKHEDGTFDESIAKLRTKVESVGRFFKLRSKLVDNIYNEILMLSSSPI